MNPTLPTFEATWDVGDVAFTTHPDWGITARATGNAGVSAQIEGVVMKQISARGIALRRPLAIIVAAAGLTVAGCANNPTNAPGAQSTAPSAPVRSSTPPTQPQAATLIWARSLCQTLRTAFSQLGAPPQPDLTNPDAMRQTFVNYLGSARSATKHVQMRTQLIALRDNLNDAVAQLKQANPNDSGAIGRAFGSAGNLVGVFGTLATDPQLRATIGQTPECQHLVTVNPTNQSPQPPG